MLASSMQYKCPLNNRGNIRNLKENNECQFVHYELGNPVWIGNTTGKRQAKFTPAFIVPILTEMQGHYKNCI